MTRKDVWWTVIYYAIVFAATWYLTYDGPPIRNVALYHTYRASQRVASTIGAIGLRAEHAYLTAVERTRT